MLHALLASALIVTAPAAEQEIPYAVAGGETLRLDLSRPSTPGPHPCVVLLHGGAWKYGSRKDVTFFADELTRRGYAAASVSYRLAPKHKWPAQIEDAKTAVRYLRANAAKLGLDPDKLAALGFSAGGHLAALLGTTDKAAGFDGPLYPEASSRVRCVVDFFGPADLPLFAETPGIEKAYFRPFLGAYKDDPAVYAKASPVANVTKAAAPFLILHGTADLIVPVIHSERLDAKLKAAGVESELITVKGGGHGWNGADAKRTTEAALQFLGKHLK